ncbi:MAG: hypothetical protein ABI775_02580 [Pseudonocardiales bacterium]
MTESKDGAHARRRRRGTSRQGPPPPPAAPAAAAVDQAVEAKAHPAPPARRQRPPRQSGEPSERGLADLVGAGRSQLGVSAALRGRDVNRPTAEDIAEAERDIAIVRRNWKPAP